MTMTTGQPQRFEIEGTCAECQTVVGTYRHARKDGSLYIPRRILECHHGRMIYRIWPVAEDAVGTRVAN